MTIKTRKTSDRVSSLSSYLREIGRTPLLKAEEEQKLARRIQAGDLQARQHMLLANLRLVVNIAKKYVPSNDPELLMDLIQDGNMGLMKAVDRFLPEFQTRFSTYGVYWIRQAVLRSLKARRLVRIPENVFDRMMEMQRVRQRLYQDLGREALFEEIAHEMGASMVEVRRLEEVSADIVSLERSVRGREDQEDTRLQDMIQDFDAKEPSEMVETSLIQDEMQSAVSTLPDREKRIIKRRFGLAGQEPRTLEEIGEEFGISRERVRQLQNTALERLRRRRAVRHVYAAA